MANTTIPSELIQASVALGGSPTTTTQSASDNTTKIATTAYVTAAVNSLIDSAPGTMNTLNEIAAALNDDASFNTTVTNAIATKLPLGGGTMTGNIAHASDFTIDAGGDIILDADGADIIFKDGGTSFGKVQNSSTNMIIESLVSDKDIQFYGNDGGSSVLALALDMSDAGTATFNQHVKLPDNGYIVLGAGEDLKINSDGANSIINAAQGYLALQTGSTERLRIDSSGDVLIGQTSQTGYAFAQKLVVGDGDNNDGITIQSGGTHQGNLAFNHSDGTTAHGRISYQHQTNYMQFFVNNSEKVKIDSAGTTSLFRAGTGMLPTLVLKNANTSVGDGAKINFTSGTSTEGAGIAGRGTALNKADLVFFAGGNVEQMRLFNTGELHITSGGAPIAPTIKHGGAVSDLAKLRLINRGGQAANKGGLLELGAVTDDGVSRSDVLGSIAGLKTNSTSANRDGYLQFSTSSGSALVERARINSSGSMLIGTTTTPSYPHKLVVAGGSISDGIAAIEDNDVSVGLANVLLRLTFSGDSVCTNGSLIYMTDANSVIGSITAASGTSVNYNTNSDERLKENIVDASSQLNTIKNIKVREFDWKKGGHHQVGLIAQELLTVIPNVVSAGGDDESKHPYGVDYGKLTPYIIKAMQEQQTLIESLTARIETLEG